MTGHIVTVNTGRRNSFNTQGLFPACHFPQQASTSGRFYNLPEQCQQLGPSEQTYEAMGTLHIQTETLSAIHPPPRPFIR